MEKQSVPSEASCFEIRKKHNPSCVCTSSVHTDILSKSDWRSRHCPSLVNTIYSVGRHRETQSHSGRDSISQVSSSSSAQVLALPTGAQVQYIADGPPELSLVTLLRVRELLIPVEKWPSIQSH
jgi:hypothetical protein